MTNWTYDTGTFISPTGERFDCDTEHGRERMLARLDGMEGVVSVARLMQQVTILPQSMTQALEKLEAK